MMFKYRLINYIIYITLLFSYSTCTKLENPITGSSNKIILTTGNVIAVNATNAQVFGDIQSSASSLQGKERGICWSISQNTVLITMLSQNTFKLSSGTGVGSFNLILSNLTPGRTYYYRSYILLSSGADVLYGDIKSFTTLPAVTTTPFTNILSTTAISGGTISSPGGAAIVQRGVCYNTTPNPFITNSRTIDGSGAGTFTSTLSNLSPSTTYYARAYATTLTGTAYGNEISFTTLCNFSGAAPNLTLPANAQAICCNNSINLSWSAVSCVTGYDIQISKSATFAGTVIAMGNCTNNSSPSNTGVSQASTTTNTFCIIGGPTNLFNGTWYWRVRAKNGNVLGSWSATRTYNYTR
jgi:hypothetical protein